MEINQILFSANLAENLDEDALIEIGKNAVEGFENDKKSRSKWEKGTKE